ncbi:MAG: hypothetical protein B6244_13540 [Candidatus Cloacimonetes bacterium 4572_55]|nr:MAG: hypothetical protein B6244_13540 [Candidatus Cloacimonetes bacterium 4572_55]
MLDKKKELTKQDILELFAESDRRFNERLAREAAEREKSQKEFDDRLAREAAEREKSQKEFDDRLAKDSAEHKKALNRAIGKITGLWGSFVEGIVEPGAIELFQKHGIHILTTLKNVKGIKDNHEFYEIDLLLLNKTHIVAIEVKTTLKTVDVDDHLKRLDKIRRYPPSHMDLKNTILLGAVAAMDVKRGADKYAYRSGLFVLRQKGGLVDIVNDENFIPKEW